MNIGRKKAQDTVGKMKATKSLVTLKSLKLSCAQESSQVPLHDESFLQGGASGLFQRNSNLSHLVTDDILLSFNEKAQAYLQK